MDTVPARLISKSADGNSAQVVVALGEGRDRMPVTRHIRCDRGHWVDDNPDKASVERMRIAEENLARSRSRFDFLQSLAELSIEEIELVFGVGYFCKDTYCYESSEEYYDLLIEFEAAKVSNTDPRARIREELVLASSALDRDQQHLTEVSVPLKVEFIFPEGNS